MDPQVRLSTGKALVLCFDGTGNKFSGTDADSNIVKIYSLLDRENPLQYQYYQPGIGTYVETSSLSRKSRAGRIKSWYTKAKDQAVGTSFGEHVMSGYKFLMRYYSPGDNIYFFGYAEATECFSGFTDDQIMLDYIGLLSAGNEEMLRFAWKTFARWQMRSGENHEERLRKKETFDFMCKFRETFSRPIERIQFIGLFDCVNSVPQFESAWMRRTRSPYTARTTAKVIRHAVSIDERRAKFRQDLISEQRTTEQQIPHHEHLHHHHAKAAEPPVLRRSSTLLGQSLFRPERRPQTHHAVASAAASRISVDSTNARLTKDEEEQDILEVWFSGQHGDIGGGWPVLDSGDRCASDLPLLWMLREARKAGFPLDEGKFQQFQQRNNPEHNMQTGLQTQVDTSLPMYETASREELNTLATQTLLHDSLRFGGGLEWYAVLSWQLMEHMPFRRMDLQPDSSWKPISWPLPRGEVRDMPHNAIVHGSVIARMRADPSYRPGNLILGGGGRGLRKAPESAGVGLWRIVQGEGDALGELVCKAKHEALKSK